MSDKWKRISVSFPVDEEWLYWQMKARAKKLKHRQADYVRLLIENDLIQSGTIREDEIPYRVKGDQNKKENES